MTTPACTKCQHQHEEPTGLLVAIFPAWFLGFECRDETACIARRIVAGHRLPLPGLAPREGVA